MSKEVITSKVVVPPAIEPAMISLETVQSPVDPYLVRPRKTKGMTNAGGQKLLRAPLRNAKGYATIKRTQKSLRAPTNR